MLFCISVIFKYFRKHEVHIKIIQAFMDMTDFYKTLLPSSADYTPLKL